MSDSIKKDFIRFSAQLVGASLAGGILAAAAEYALTSVLRGTRFWGEPRFYYQILLGVEAAWLGVLASVSFGVCGGLYYLIAKRRRELALAFPALWIVAVAACGTPAAHFLAVADVSFPWVKSRFAIVGAAAFFLGVVGLWALSAAGLYKVLGALCRRFKRCPAKAAAVIVAAALLLPAAAADVYYMISGRGEVARRPDVYVVVMDAFRADRLSFYRGGGEVAPRLEAFGREGAVFEEAYTVSSWTKPAVASLFTSAYPGTHGVTSRVAALPADAETLAEVMAGLGYATIAVSANPHVSWGGGMGDGFDVLDCTAGGSVMEAGGPPLSAARLFTSAAFAPSFLGPLWHRTTDGLEVNRRLEFWFRITDAPRFVYVHYMEPHTPYRPREEDGAGLEPYFKRARKNKIKEIVRGRFFGARLTKDPDFRPDYASGDVALAKALYDSDVRRMDGVIADFLDAVIPAYSRAEEPIIVVTADHGEEFLEHGRWLHGSGLHGEIARVPLMIGGAGRGPVRGAVNVVDVAPTVVALAGGIPPDSWAGSDLASYILEGGRVPPRELLLEGIIEYPPVRAGAPWTSIELAAVADGGYYYLYDYNAGREYLYDGARDRKQRNNLAAGRGAADDADSLARRRDSLAGLRRTARARAWVPRYVKLSPSLERQLRAMGYVN
jgi:arylsulfatase A-like enzyme